MQCFDVVLIHGLESSRISLSLGGVRVARDFRVRGTPHLSDRWPGYISAGGADRAADGGGGTVEGFAGAQGEIVGHGLASVDGSAENVGQEGF